MLQFGVRQIKGTVPRDIVCQEFKHFPGLNNGVRSAISIPQAINPKYGVNSENKASSYLTIEYLPALASSNAPSNIVFHDFSIDKCFNLDNNCLAWSKLPILS